MAGAWDRISMFWGERKIGEETYLHLKLLYFLFFGIFGIGIGIGMGIGFGIGIGIIPRVISFQAWTGDD